MSVSPEALLVVCCKPLLPFLVALVLAVIAPFHSLCHFSHCTNSGLSIESFGPLSHNGGEVVLALSSGGPKQWWPEVVLTL